MLAPSSFASTGYGMVAAHRQESHSKAKQKGRVRLCRRHLGTIRFWSRCRQASWVSWAKLHFIWCVVICPNCLTVQLALLLTVAVPSQDAQFLCLDGAVALATSSRLAVYRFQLHVQDGVLQNDPARVKFCFGPWCASCGARGGMPNHAMLIVANNMSSLTAFAVTQDTSDDIKRLQRLDNRY